MNQEGYVIIITKAFKSSKRRLMNVNYVRISMMSIVLGMRKGSQTVNKINTIELFNFKQGEVMKKKTKKWVSYIGLGVVTVATVTIAVAIAYGIGHAGGIIESDQFYEDVFDICIGEPEYIGQ